MAGTRMTVGCGRAARLWAVMAVAGGVSLAPVNAQSPAADSAVAWTHAKHAGEATLRVLYVPADGFANTAGGDSVTGVTAEIMRAFARWVAQRHDVAVSLHFVEEQDWRVFYGRVRDAHGGVFGLGNVTITDERRRELSFSPPYLTNVAVLITHDSISELNTLEDVGTTFSGLSALAFEGTLHEERLRFLRDVYTPDATVEMARSNSEIIERVTAGGYFAYVDAYNYWRAQEQGAPLRRHAVGDDPAEEFGIIMPLNNDWAPLLEEFFSRDGGFRNAPEYRSILEAHLGSSLTEALEAARQRATAPTAPGA
jgi:ABC-type amino acid transport substrate-binding protein